ncbi:hypothetical protein [Bacillus sp. COPE52]|uniref:hypothetical protein n=1 Tax=Bacillus sp. COPE52 TaxID=2233998 RepID=UPI000E101138|nr:hypothetical protein [Bacillus sp. COPE52]AXK21489.1 hypothetical protein DPQ31_28890 [Bacillus sp. COPE52]
MGKIKGMNHLFIRFLYLGVAWLVALRPIFSLDETTKTAFCATLFLFFVPLIIDYFGFEDNSKTGMYLKMIGGYTSLFALAVVVSVSFDGIGIDMKKKLLMGLSFENIWWFLFFWVALSFVDWIYFSKNPYEKQFTEEVVSDYRKETSYDLSNTIESRTDHHEKQFEVELAATKLGEVSTDDD